MSAVAHATVRARPPRPRPSLALAVRRCVRRGLRDQRRAR